MAVLVITPPAPIVSLDRAKAHVGEDATDQDGLINALVAAATVHLDGPDGVLGRALGLQTLELRLEDFEPHHREPGSHGRRHPHEAAIPLPCPPLVDITSVKYTDPAGVEQTLDPAAYVLGTHGLAPAFGTSWPPTRWQDDALRIRYRAGWSGTGDAWTGPEAIRVAILMMVGDLFENRETQVISDGRAVQLANPTADLLLSPWKVWA